MTGVQTCALPISFLKYDGSFATLWFRAPAWFREKVIDPIKKAFKTAGDWIKEKFGAALNGIKGIAANVVNWVIRMLNKIQINIPDWVPGLGGKK